VLSADDKTHEPVRRLVLVHGRDQQHRDPNVLKDRWLEAFGRGARTLGRPVPKVLDVSFPYYGDVLDKFARASKIPLTTDIQARGSDHADAKFLAFEAAVGDQLRRGAGISDQDVDVEYRSDPKARGPENWEWVQAIIRTLDKYVGTTRAIESFMRDVYLYAVYPGVRDEIDRIVSAALTEEPALVVGHSLGSVVAYNTLRTDTRSLHIPLFVTLGCPLAIRAIRSELVPLRYPQPPVVTWNNAFDSRDLVALYPLDSSNFPVNPTVTNYSKVNNHTHNRHGIDGYLDDPVVAGWLLDALS
jgi:hypothetical protein